MVGISTGAKISSLKVDQNLDMGAYKILTDDIDEHTGAHGVDVDSCKLRDGSLVGALSESAIIKKASANLRNSYDAEAHCGFEDASYHLLKTMTFTNGIKGTLRIKFERKANGAYVVYGRVYKNGVALGTADGGSDQTYTEFSEDVDVGTIAAGETLELWGKAEAAGSEIWVQNFRMYYDNVGGAAVVVNS